MTDGGYNSIPVYGNSSNWYLISTIQVVASAYNLPSHHKTAYVELKNGNKKVNKDLCNESLVRL